MTLLQMRTRVSERLAEGTTGPVFYPSAEIDASLREALRFFVLLTLGLEVTKPWAVPSFAANAAMPFFHLLQYFPDLICPLRLATIDGTKVRPASLATLNSLDGGWLNVPGTPERYTSLGVDFVALYPQFAAGGTLNLTYARGPVPLLVDEDTPEIPDRYHPLLVGYGVYRMRQVEGGGEFAKALPLLGEFLAGAAVYAEYVRARNKGAGYDHAPVEASRYKFKLPRANKPL